VSNIRVPSTITSLRIGVFAISTNKVKPAGIQIDSYSSGCPSPPQVFELDHSLTYKNSTPHSTSPPWFNIFKYVYGASQSPGLFLVVHVTEVSVASVTSHNTLSNLIT
jgi:hypothetical protein